MNDTYSLFCRQFGMPPDSFQSGGGSNRQGTARVVTPEEAQQSLETSRDIYGPHFQYRTVVEFNWDYFVATLESGPLAGYTFLFYLSSRIVWIGRSLQEGIGNISRVFSGHRWDESDPLFNRDEPGLHGLLEESSWLREASRTPQEIEVGSLLMAEGRPARDHVKGHLYSAALWLLPPDQLRVYFEDFFSLVYHSHVYRRLQLDKSGLWAKWIGEYESWSDLIVRSLPGYLPSGIRLEVDFRSTLTVHFPDERRSHVSLPRNFPRQPAEIARRVLKTATQ